MGIVECHAQWLPVLAFIMTANKGAVFPLLSGDSRWTWLIGFLIPIVIIGILIWHYIKTRISTSESVFIGGYIFASIVMLMLAFLFLGSYLYSAGKEIQINQDDIRLVRNGKLLVQGSLREVKKLKKLQGSTQASIMRYEITFNNNKVIGFGASIENCDKLVKIVEESVGKKFE